MTIYACATKSLWNVNPNVTKAIDWLSFRQVWQGRIPVESWGLGQDELPDAFYYDASTRPRTYPYPGMLTSRNCRKMACLRR